MSFDVFYGCVVMSVPPNKVRKMKNAAPVVAFFLPDWKPIYIDQCTHYLSYTVNENYYKIYNPDGYSFDLDDLIYNLRVWHYHTDGAFAQDFRVLEQINW